MKITKLQWHDVEDLDFYRVDYELDGFWHRIQLSKWVVRQTGIAMPDAIAHLLRSDFACEPIEMVFR